MPSYFNLTAMLLAQVRLMIRIECHQILDPSQNLKADLGQHLLLMLVSFNT